MNLNGLLNRIDKDMTVVYEQLPNYQRLRMVLEAAARGDMAERMRLLNSCPRRVYRRLDAGFDLADDAIVIIVLIVAIDVLSDIRCARMARAADKVIDLMIAHAGLPGPDQPIEGDLPAWHEALGDFALHIWTCARRAKSQWLGFDRICRERVGLDGMTVFRAWLPGLADEVEAFGPHWAKLQTDEEEMRQYADILNRHFDKAVQIGAAFGKRPREADRPSDMNQATEGAPP